MLRKSETEADIAEEKLTQCLQYFLSSETLRTLLQGFYEKYRSFGTVCGSVRLRNLNENGIEALEGLTGKNFHGKQSASLSAEKIQKCLDVSCYAGVKLDELVARLYPDELKSKKQEQQEYDAQYAAFFEQLVYDDQDTVGGKWLQAVLTEHSDEERILRRRFRECSGNRGGGSVSERSDVFSTDGEYYSKVPDLSGAIEDLRRAMQNLICALNSLPVWTGSYEYLPVFAARVSGDPHYFDHGQKDTFLFYCAINHVLQPDGHLQAPLRAEMRRELLLRAGIIVDPVSNDAMIYGLRGWAKNQEHMGLAGFFEQKEPFSITLSTIMRLERISCRDNRVYVVENPVVFARLTEMEDISAVCGNGQPNQAVLLLLDRIAQDDVKIYYNGDYDPEGLMIAQRMKNRYGEKLVLWHYTQADYMQALSEKTIADGRMKMLDKLTSPELVEIAGFIRQTKRAGYQERVKLQTDS